MNAPNEKAPGRRSAGAVRKTNRANSKALVRSPQAESRVLALLVQEGLPPDAGPTLRRLATMPEAFEDKLGFAMASAAAGIVKRYGKTGLDKLDDLFPELDQQFELEKLRDPANAPATVQAENYAEDILEEYRDRLVKTAVADAYNDLDQQPDCGAVVARNLVETLTTVKAENSNGLPAFERFDYERAALAELPPVVVEGMLRKGHKGILVSGSKGQKSWAMVQLAVCVTHEREFLGRKVAGGDVLYVNFELSQAEAEKRVVEIKNAFGLADEDPEHRLMFWHLQKFKFSAVELVTQIMERARKGEFVLMIIDPLYKLLAGLNENAANEVGDLLTDLQRLCVDLDVCLIFTDHQPKGDMSERDAIDLASGSGVKARDSDCLIAMRKQRDWSERNRTYVVNTVVRGFPPVEDYVVRFDHPLWRVDHDAAPVLKERRKPRKYDDAKILDLVSVNGSSFSAWSDAVERNLGVPISTFKTYLARYLDEKLVSHEDGIYRRPGRPE